MLNMRSLWASARRMLAGGTLMAGVAVMGACSDSTAPNIREIHSVILELHDGSIAYMHGDHWHGSLSVHHGESEHVHIYYVDQELAGHDAPPKAQWKLLPTKGGYQVVGVSENTAIARWTQENVREASLQGVAEGATRVNLVVKRNGTTLYEAAPLNVSVGDHDDDDHDHDH